MKSPFCNVELLDHGGHGIVFQVRDGIANLALKLFFGSDIEEAREYANQEYGKLTRLRWLEGVPTVYTLFPELNFEDFGELPFEPSHNETIGFTMELMTDVSSIYGSSVQVPRAYFTQLRMLARTVHKRGLALPNDLEHNLFEREDGLPVSFDWGDAEYLVRGRKTVLTRADFSRIRELENTYTG